MDERCTIEKTSRSAFSNKVCKTSKDKNRADKQGNPPTTHTVKDGELLFDIAQAYYGDGNQWKKVSSANADVKPETLKIGQELKIPA